MTNWLAIREVSFVLSGISIVMSVATLWCAHKLNRTRRELERSTLELDQRRRELDAAIDRLEAARDLTA